MAILTYPLNGITYDAEDAETYLCTRTSGVYSADDNFQASVTGSREVTISPGIAWIKNGDFYGKAICSKDPVAVNVPISDGATSRMDRIVLRFDKQANETTIERLQGEGSSDPVPPDVTQTEEVYELGLCMVYVGATAVSLSAADITSTLTDESVCGIMRDGVTQIPTAALYEQFYEVLAVLRGLIDDVKEDMYVTVNDYRSMTEVELLADNWTGSAAPYEQRITVEGITDATVLDTGIVYPEDVTWSEQKQISKNAAYIYEIETQWDEVVFRASNKPTIDFTIGLKGAV